MGPPEKGPVIRVTGRGIDVLIRVENDLDREIVTLAIAMAERRRYSKA